ncbi:CRISPR-associated helicase/endonuclease Cas3 [Bacillus niameyensis]|uniref:CRISPR-associated helicase/endonuclease Cas3 n=1 Tax=Bacillus niameyensis TaxID=1522308 RepID=UPI000780972B|nr:CRISPR-associated helicase/endonuclease Cas3 [Bacillus niameyensis]
MFLAHIRESDHVEQSVQEHLEEVALLARQYGNLVNLGAHAELSGFLHDMGKFTIHFTTYLKNAVLENNVAKEKIDHSTAGAKYLYDHFYGKSPLQDYVVETVGMAILSHHSGLQNFVQPDLKLSDYVRRVTNETLPYYDEVVRNFERIKGNKEKVEQLVEEAKLEFQAFTKKVKALGYPAAYLTLMQKLVFSCLIDADRTNTRCFEENEAVPNSNNECVFREGYQYLMKTIESWKKGDIHPINELRNEMSDKCDQFASNPSSIYSLSIPTGGGKTYASLRYALRHADLHQKSRIIYVVPYTTILEQNAQAVRNMIAHPEAVLEHHANVMDDVQSDNETDFYDSHHHKQLQLGRENWDYPIIFTTMVQFLDAFYQKGTRKSRRLHHLTNAVIVFDEVQSVPFQHRALFNTAINFLHTIGNSSIMLCTATQPALDKVKPEVNIDAEIVPKLDEVVDAFKRVVIRDLVEPEGWDSEQIASFAEKLILESESLLIILNTKTAVRKLYQMLKKQGVAHLVHLSTSMCPEHRKVKLAEIKDKLGKEKVICVSTQLIEAGVDISFESVIRSLAGLDSIAQAAGRCNRNGEREQGDVYIIRAKDENLDKLPEIRIGAEVTANYILSEPKFAKNLLSPAAIRTYSTHFLAQAQREILIAPRELGHTLFSLMDGSTAMKQRPKTRSLGMFKTIERHFEAIDSPTTAVIVPYGEGKDIIANLNEDIRDIKVFNQLMKKAQQYSVNLYKHESDALNTEGMISPLYDNAIYCLNEKAYDESYGVTIDGQAELVTYNF